MSIIYQILQMDYSLFVLPHSRGKCLNFQEAKKLGIHRTVHAGENGSSELVAVVSWEKSNEF